MIALPSAEAAESSAGNVATATSCNTTRGKLATATTGSTTGTGVNGNEHDDVPTPEIPRNARFPHGEPASPARASAFSFADFSPFIDGDAEPPGLELDNDLAGGGFGVEAVVPLPSI